MGAEAWSRPMNKRRERAVFVKICGITNREATAEATEGEPERGADPMNREATAEATAGEPERGADPMNRWSHLCS